MRLKAIIAALMGACLLVAPVAGVARPTPKDSAAQSVDVSTVLGRYGAWEVELDGHIQVGMRHVQSVGTLIEDYQQERNPALAQAMVERRVATMLAEIDAASAAIEAMPIPDVTLLELAAHLRPEVSLAGARELIRNVRALVARFPETIADMHSGDNLRAQRATVRVLEGSQLILRVTIRGETALMVDDEPGTTEYHSSLLFLGYLRATDRLLGTMMTLTRGEADRTLPADLTAMAAAIDENVLALTETVRASKAETVRNDAAGDADVARIQTTMDRVDLLYLEINATYRELSNILRQIAATSQRNPTSLSALGPYFTRIRTLRERIETNTRQQTQLFAELADADASR